MKLFSEIGFTKTNKILFFKLLLVFFLTGCSGGGGGSSTNDNDQTATGGSSPPANPANDSPGNSDTGSESKLEISGLWDYSDGDPDDDWYLYIDEEGFFSEYDYRGDATDNEDNCYDIIRDWAQITKEGSLYEFMYTGGEPEVVEIQFGETPSGDNGFVIVSAVDNDIIEYADKIIGFVPSVVEMESMECIGD